MPQPTQLLGWYYLDMGDTAQAIRFYQEQADQQPGNLEIRFRLAGVYERTGRDQEALEQLEYVLRLDPDSRDAAMAAVGMAIRIDSVEKARKFLSDWLMRHPEDTAAQQALDDINRQLQGDSSP